MAHILADIPVLDCHIHFGHPDFMSGLIKILDDNHIQRFNLVCTPHRERLSLVPDALYVKGHYPNRAYVFGGLDISPLFISPDQCGSLFADYAETLSGMGCDGIKMIEGKPEMRRMLPIPPFDSPAYAPYWEKLAELEMPVVFHVNDPEEFWDSNRVPAWAREQGWFYGDGSYINNETQYNEVIRVMERNPSLKIIFAHFFFMSAQLPRLAELLERFPNMHVDLTPGIEMYSNFAMDIEAARDFFLDYQDRILYGTDIGARSLLAPVKTGIDPEDSDIRTNLIRNFLEHDGGFQLNIQNGFLFGKFSGSFKGLGLPEDILHKIYHANFERLAGEVPKRINPDRILAECERLIMMIPAMGATQPGAGDTSIASMVKAYFQDSKFDPGGD